MAGYRWREENTLADRDPGDEWFMHLGAGGRVGPLGWQVAVDALCGRPLTVLGFRLPNEARRLIQVIPTVGLPLGPGEMEVSAQFHLAGCNLPVGRGISLGYRLPWGVPPSASDLLEELLEPR